MTKTELIARLVFELYESNQKLDEIYRYSNKILKSLEPKDPSNYQWSEQHLGVRDEVIHILNTIDISSFYGEEDA